MTDAEVISTLNDVDALALTLFGEARGEPLEGKAAVASVVMNRVKHPDRYGDTIRDVCLQPKQFSCWNGGDANYARLMGMAERMKANHLGTDPDGATMAECVWVAEGYAKGLLRSRVDDCDHYLTRQLWLSPQRPSWAEGPVIPVGSQVFLQVA